ETSVGEGRAGDDAPACAIPVLEERLEWGYTALPSDGPHVIAGHGDHRLEETPLAEGGGGDDAPARSVEGLGERGRRPTATEDLADGPDVVGGDRRGPDE